eukprot:TRINITY_DN11772_c0_g1_i1.p1 TRINITY_DN11772_c0_g1~~TRINITY_DN11772_c0_g1_i1.p1  ORF type:complete len:464 (-),score=113.28 TRINITY_DN11772_c0_g1_i1:1161-2552(-)
MAEVAAITIKDLPKYLPLANRFLEFVNGSPTAYHAVENAKKILLSEGFVQLSERDSWNLKPLGKFFFTRNQSTIVAFALGGKYEPGNGFSLVGAHTDSPHLNIKPKPDVSKDGFLQLEVETYGGGLWTTWFDRDLTIAGRVIVKNGSGFESRLLRVERPILRIPTIAIHLNRETGTKLEFNPQTQLFPILATGIKTALEGESTTQKQSVLQQLVSEELKVEASDIQELDLSVVDTQKAVLGGLHSEFIFSPRLDNLMMSFCSLMGLVEALKSKDFDFKNEKNVIGIALFDHEEVGSASAHGAGSPIIGELVKRITDSEKLYETAIRKSFLISADMAHSVHPNYADKHDPNHKPAIHQGVVVKHNANQRYATTAATAFLLREIARKASVPLQDFVVRNDSPCGSTIGPIISARTGIRTVDIGNPQLSMHSIREMCGVVDVTHGSNLIKQFFQSFSDLDEKLVVD